MLNSALLDAIQESGPDGIDATRLYEAIEFKLDRVPSERTVRSRLARLAKSGLIHVTGKTKNRRYFAATPTESEPATHSHNVSETIPISHAGLEIQRLVSAPLTHRKPAGYNEDFLDRYVPGKTWYLSAETRNHLSTIGQTDTLTRPAGTFARDIYERLLIDLAWSSSRLEGNTYSRLDTQNLFEHSIRADGKDANEAVMLLNHKRAIALLVDEAEQIGFDRYTIFNLHAALSEGLMPPRDEGRLRERVVGISGSSYVPLSIPQKIEEHFDVILAKATDIPDPFEQSIFMMVHLPYLQPFADVNKRTSRLAANISLVQHNYCPLSFIGVPEQLYVEATLGIYELNRIDLLRDMYVWAYERSAAQYRAVQQSAPQPDPLRLRYRQQINKMVREFVVAEERPTRKAIADWVARTDIPVVDYEPVSDLVLELLINLHEGSTYRYGLRVSEFQRWKQMIEHSTTEIAS
ncbi:MAG: Fic family protein [Gemmatimonas sp.]